MIAIAAALVLLVGPLVLGLNGLMRRGGASADSISAGIGATAWNWRLTLTSAVLYALAFNLTFFIQELFLVLPKAFTPGLRPTLFHNNHSWQGDHPLASAFQGTGALATLLVGVSCALLLRRGRQRSDTVRLLLIWMAYNGCLQALPQVAFGAVNPRNDVGMAMDFLQLGTMAKSAAALVALAAIPVLAFGLIRPLLSVADDPALIATARARTSFVFRVATLPALVAIALIIPFRVPRELIEVLLMPVVVTISGIVWIQAGAWCVDDVSAKGGKTAVSLAYPLLALLALLFLFQVVLRPGVAFF
jgi:hypothetical protein